MKNKKYCNITVTQLNEIVNSAYGDGSYWHKIKIFFWRKINPEIENIYCEHKMVASKIKNIGAEECPKHLVLSVESRLGFDTPARQTFWEDLYSIYLFKPAFSLTVILIITAGLLFSVLQDNGNAQYTNEEIEVANKQAKETLLIVSSIFNKTSSTLTKDILPDKVAKRINNGINIIEDLFKENKNETIN